VVKKAANNGFPLSIAFSVNMLLLLTTWMNILSCFFFSIFLAAFHQGLKQKNNSHHNHNFIKAPGGIT